MICSDNFRVSFTGTSRSTDMPFSSLTDPADLARAESVLEAAWRELELEIPEEDRQYARLRLSYLVASFALVAQDEADLIARCIDRIRNRTL